WEVAVLALAGGSLYEILSRGTVPFQRSANGGTPTVDSFLLLFPILFLAGTAGLAVRGVRRLFPRLRSASARTRAPVYLAAHRLAGATRTALGMVTAVALAIGILTYAGTLAASVTATSKAKALVFTGSNVSVSVTTDSPIPGTIGPLSTKVIAMGF